MIQKYLGITLLLLHHFGFVLYNFDSTQILRLFTLHEIFYQGMEYLQNGNFFGQTNEMLQLENLTITETEYVRDKIDWHYHEHAYFTFILSGELLEGNKKQQHRCSTGTLLFHNWQEPHYNIIPKGNTKSLHIELKKNFLNYYSLNNNHPHGSIVVDDPDVKILFHHIHKETKLHDSVSAIEIESLFLKVSTKMTSESNSNQSRTPLWVNKIKDILYSKFSEKITLDYLANELNIHPVHLSRDFSKYFNCSLGNYIRKIKVERALSMLSNKSTSLTDITFDCGFADQSHFLRCFKEIMGIKPSEYRKIIFH